MRRLGGTAAAAVVLLTLTACTAPAATTSASPAASAASAPPSSVAPPNSVTPSATTPSAVPTSSATTSAADPDRPDGQCADDALGVSVVASEDGGAAGSSYSQILFTNTGGESCVLRGTPGVSVVDGSGTQLGPAADRNQSGVRNVRIPVGGSAVAQLQIVDIGTDGGPLPDCTVVHGAGYRVYPPHSTNGFVVDEPKAVACSKGPVFMTVGPVIAFGG